MWTLKGIWLKGNFVSKKLGMISFLVKKEALTVRCFEMKNFRNLDVNKLYDFIFLVKKKVFTLKCFEMKS